MLLCAVDSVLKQSYKKIEIIVVDDNSFDKTFEEIDNIKDDRIVYIKNDKNKGASFSRNRGFKNANGDLISFLDDDDEWFPKKLEKQIEKFKTCSDKIGVVYTGYQTIYKGTVKYITTPIYKGDLSTISLLNCPVGSPTPLIKKEVLNQIGLYDDDMPSCQDWDLWLRIAQKFEFDYVPEILANYHIHGMQISTDLTNKINGRKIILKKHFDIISKNKNILSKHYSRLGSLLAFNNDCSNGRRYFIKSIKADKTNYLAYIHLILSFNKFFHKLTILKLGIKKIDSYLLFH